MLDESRIKLLEVKELLTKPVSMRDLADAVSRIMGLDSPGKP
jgi:hypothetical protein